MSIADKVTFVSGPYAGSTFIKGTGPTKRVLVNGIVKLQNSTNFWYSGDTQLSFEYLTENQSNQA